VYYWTLNKEDPHCFGDWFVNGVGKLLNVLTVGSGLFSKDFEFVADVILVVCDPILYVGLWFCDEVLHKYGCRYSHECGEVICVWQQIFLAGWRAYLGETNP